MDATIALKTQFSAWIDTDKFARRPDSSLPFSRKLKKQRLPKLISCHLQPRRTSNWQIHVGLEASGSYKNLPAALLEPGSFPLDEDLILKDKAQEILPYIDGRCIYLVGMMGSGKTTIGMILAKMLGYSFCDSDTLIEKAVKGTSVAEIFKRYGEGFFRNKESEILKNLSAMRHLVVSTGGGAVIQPINWKYMNKGISVWLDVPLEALAQRITAVGTSSRPLLHQDSGDAYSRALARLSDLWEARADAYANASARVSLREMAAKLGDVEVTNLSPTVIAIEALLQIEAFLKRENVIDAF